MGRMLFLSDNLINGNLMCPYVSTAQLLGTVDITKIVPGACRTS